MEKIKVMIVEDESILVLNLQKLLERLGYDVCATTGLGEKAVELAKIHKPDVIMMDIHLGGEVDGIEAAKRIRSFSDVPILYTTAFSDEETLLRAEKTEPSSFVLKPFQVKDLQMAIERAHLKHLYDRKSREQEQRFSVILKNIGDGVLTVGGAGTVTYCNAAAERLTGWSAEEAEGRSCKDVLSPFTEDTGTPVPVQDLAANTDVAVPAIGRRLNLLNRRQVTVPVEIRANLLEDENGRTAGSVYVLRDMTYQKTAEEEKRIMQQALARSQKTEALGRFAGGIVHDFNNYLFLIKNYAELQKKENLLCGLESDHIQAILNVVEKAKALVHTLSLFSRNKSFPRQPVDVNSATANLMALIQRILNARIRISVDPDPRQPSVWADPIQFEQVLMNLILNARDAMVEGGQLVVRIRSVRLCEGDLHDFPQALAGEYARLSVADTGSGMDEEVLKHVFQPFFTTREEGSGLGLFVLNEIVRSHGGCVRIESQLGKGTVVDVYFPVECASNPDGEMASFTLPKTESAVQEMCSN